MRRFTFAVRRAKTFGLKHSVNARSQLDQFLTRVARAGFFSLLSLGCLVAFSLCSSPTTYAPILKRADGSPVLDSSGNLVIVQNWKTDLVNNLPIIAAFATTTFFLVLAIRALVGSGRSVMDKPKD